MPRRSVLSDSERSSLLVVPETDEELIRHYEFSESDMALIRQRRGDPNRLGLAVQLCLLRFPGQGLLSGTVVPEGLLRWVGQQLRIAPACWSQYAAREETRREHLLELRTYLGLAQFGLSHFRASVRSATDLALQTDKGMVLASTTMEILRERKVLVPTIEVIERICAEAITRANRRIFAALTDPLSDGHRQRLDALLAPKEGGKTTWLTWLRLSPAKPNSRYMLEHIERLKAWLALDLPVGMAQGIHQNRLLKIAREGGQMRAADLAKFEAQRRYATLVALAIEGTATVTDEIVELHDRILGKLFNAARTKHREAFHESGKAINDKVRLYGTIGQALVDAKDAGTDAFAAIEAILSWDAFTASVDEAQKLAQSEDFDFLHLLGGHYSTFRRYAPVCLEILRLRAAPAAKGVLDAIELLRTLNAENTRKVPADAPTDFISKRWRKLMLTPDGIDRRYYELCALHELRNALRSGDIWVRGSRQFRDFDEYLVPAATFASLKRDSALPLAVITDCDAYLRERLSLLNEQLATVNRLGAADELPDAEINASGLKVTPLDAVLPDEGQALINQAAAMLPHVKVTEMLQEVHGWTGFTRHFTHLKTGEPAKDQTLLLTTLLADGINLGLSKMAESCPGTTYAKLPWQQAWHVRDETHSAGLAELVNAQTRHPFAVHWGDGTTSSSDGQRFRADGRAESTGHINPKYGGDPGRNIYTHVSDQYAPFSSKVVNVGIRDATYVLDGLLYHESDLRISEHYTDTAGFTDHVFAMMHLLGYRFAPRIRGLGDTKLHVPRGDGDHAALKPMIGGTLNIKQIRAHWEEILRLATSIKQGTVTASLMLRKLGSYPRQNGLAVALRELGRIERTLFILDWLQSVDLRRRVHAGLNKGEARNALARAVFFNRLGEIRDRSFEQQRYRASGLNLITAALVLWNTVYLDRAIATLRSRASASTRPCCRTRPPSAGSTSI